MAPSDTYRIWKRGSSVRVDTTLLGFEGMRWQRGRRSFLFQASRGGGVDGGEQATVEMVQVGAIPCPETVPLDLKPYTIGTVLHRVRAQLVGHRPHLPLHLHSAWMPLMSCLSL